MRARAGLRSTTAPPPPRRWRRRARQFDVILNMEVVEHVADVDLFIEACGQMVKPGGLMFIATINRTLKALGLAIFGAEYVLRWLPRGTHQYEKLVRPEELTAALGKAGMDVSGDDGVFYNPLTDAWNRSKDTDVNYMVLSTKPKRLALSGAAPASSSQPQPQSPPRPPKSSADSARPAASFPTAIPPPRRHSRSGSDRPGRRRPAGGSRRRTWRRRR